jgi:hypothetical protein
MWDNIFHKVFGREKTVGFLGNAFTGQGFAFMFENGWCVSVQWSPQHTSPRLETSSSNAIPFGDAILAEVLVRDSKGRTDFPYWRGDNPIWHQTPEQVTNIMARVARKASV